MQKATLSILAGLLIGAGLQTSAFAWARANAWGGHSEGGFGGMSHTNRFGGTSSASWDGAYSHTNAYGGHTSGVAGYGAVHTGPGGGSFYHPPTGYAGYGYHPPVAGYPGYAPYHPPVAVPYYHAGCYDCAGAVAAGAVVGVAAGAAIATAAAHPVVAAVPFYPIGTSIAVLPPSASFIEQGGVSYYQVGNTWYRPAYGANGVFYTVVAPPL